MFFEEHTATVKKNDEAGLCIAIAQGIVVGIDPSSSERVAYIFPRDAIDAMDRQSWDAPLLQSVNLPCYESRRPLLLHEITRGILLVAADRAVVEADDQQLESFYSAVMSLSGLWEGAVGLVLSFVQHPPVCVWPLGEP